MDKDPFEFEILLKSMESQISSEQKGMLQIWRNKEIACLSEWEKFYINKSEVNALNNKKLIEGFLNHEVEIKTLITDLFLSIPDPTTAVNLFDAGKERDRLNKLTEDVIKIQTLVYAAFSIHKSNIKVILDFLSHSTQSSSYNAQTSTAPLDYADVTQDTIDRSHLMPWSYADFISELLPR